MTSRKLALGYQCVLKLALAQSLSRYEPRHGKVVYSLYSVLLTLHSGSNFHHTNNTVLHDGSFYTASDRVAYVIIKGIKGAAAYEKFEDPLYVLENNIVY